MPPVHDETEYALPVERAAAALALVADLIARERLRVNFVVEVRFVRADDAWLSPARGRDTVTIGAYIAASPSRARYLDAVEEALLKEGGRPHWGKRMRAPQAALAAAYPRLADFRALRDACDPARTLDNAFLQRLFVA